jgi:hypothetical protein
VVVLVGMADATRRNDPPLSVETRPPVARWLVVGAAVLVPVIVGALASLVLYATRPGAHAAPPIPMLVPVAAAISDTTIADGALLVIQPATTNRIDVPVGQVVEIVLEAGPGQRVVSNTPAILMPVTPNPPCQIVTLCDAPGAASWTFDAAHVGMAYLIISFGRHCSPTTGLCDNLRFVLLKPIGVYPRTQPQAQ